MEKEKEILKRKLLNLLNSSSESEDEPEPIKKKRRRVIFESDSDHEEAENTPLINHIPNFLQKMGHIKTPENTIQIDEQMKDLWNHIIKNGLEENTKNDILKKIPTIIDCLTPAPQLNLEIQAAMTAQAVTRDNHLCEKQNIISTIICGLTDILNKNLHNNTDQDNTSEYLGNCIRLLCHVQFKESQTRRAVILPGLNKKVKNVLEKTEINNFLFGKDINTVLKENKNIENSVKDLKTSLNNWSPSSYRKQGGGRDYNQQPQPQPQPRPQLRPRPQPQKTTTAGKQGKPYQHQRQQQLLRSMTKQTRTSHNNRGHQH